MLTVLLVVVGVLTALDIYQNRIIQTQRFELGWLLTHSTIRPDTILADLQKKTQGAPASDAVKAPPANVAAVPPVAKPATPQKPTARP